jgi:PIN domain nuclease of toxin-antitoxin system
MISAVLDASALLAFLRREPGVGRVGEVLADSVISTVCLAEVLSTALDQGASLQPACDAVGRLPIVVRPFDPQDAYIAASLRPLTRRMGLSLADRASIALGQKLGLTVLTTHKSWREVLTSAEIEIIR